MAATPVKSILKRITAAGESYEGKERGSRETLIDLARDLVAALELPSEFLQRSFWAEVSRKSSFSLDNVHLLTFSSQRCLLTANSRWM